MKFSGKQAIGFLITGAAAGTILSLLYAPKSGVQTRRDLRRFTKKTANRLETLQEDIRESVGCLVEDVGEIVQDGISTGKKYGNQARDQVSEAFDTAKKVVEEGRSKILKMMP